ncbi:hypothetical protein K1719_019484 [Acacia pycnantha]|nr:hypothetical protein K1719_019484 [Acacia pycnantha]
MASSSSSTPSPQPRNKYDVFISFRGEDTRLNFTSHLHEALHSNQIDTYIDYRLEKGDEVWPSLEKAIEDSILFLVIFSENYASSTWCLKELAKILECSKNEGHLVMPVFYGVDPSHIRKQSGSYQKAFEQHEHKGIDKQQLQNWREALTHTANLSGWHCGVDRNEAELITEIIKCVVQKLDDKYQSEDYLKDLIGIHRRMADVESLLYKGSNNDVRFIGIWGMGGVGKTTLAKALFNKFHSAYEGSCFLSSVREKSKKYGIAALKKKLILELLGDKESHIDMVDDTIPAYAIRRLSRKKNFIVLDDVDDHHEQLENLAGRHRWFGPGSKILVTTRDKQVFGKEVDYIYKLEALNSDEAFQLFSLNAFKKDYGGDPKMRELAKKVTRYADGNPLALKVLGSFLKISMHHLIKEMGRQIVREQSLNDPQKCSRLWDSNEISEILKENKGGDAIEGIILEASELLEEICLSPLALSSMPNLKFLIFHKDFKENKLKFPCGIEFLPNKLKLLCWKEYPSKSLPATFKGENLVQIQMTYSNLTKLWDGDQNLVNLREIDLLGSRDLIELPNFSKAIHLEQVNLSLCSKLRSVHPSILSLHSLRRLLLRDCEALTSLTSNTHLKSLSDLDLGGCSRLNKFSVISESLFDLDLSGTAINDELCSSSGRLNKIDSLSINGCESVRSLNNLVDLRTLTRLYASNCNKLASNLRSLFNEIRTLKILRLTDCNELFEVPENISLLSSLVELDLSRTNIETLPLSIKYLSSLQDLYLVECKRLRFLPELPPYISNLSTENCISLETLHLSHIHNNYDVSYMNFMFTNCMKLDGQSIKSVETKVLLDINKAIYKYIRMEYPGERFPEWFMYRTTQCLVTVDLRSIPEPWDGSFIFCIVISKSLDERSVDTGIDAKWFLVLVNWFIDGQKVEDGSCNILLRVLMLSDHIVLWYDRDSYGEVQRKIEEKKRDAESNTYHPLLQIQFTGRVGDIKECGVCPTSALECQNYIQQIQNDIGIATANSFYWILKNLENWIRLDIKVIDASSLIIKEILEA